MSRMMLEEEAAAKAVGGGGSIPIQPNYYVNEDYADNHDPTVLGLVTNMTWGASGKLISTATSQVVHSDAVLGQQWATYSGHYGTDSTTDLDMYFEIGTHRTMSPASEGFEMALIVPNVTGGYIAFDLYASSGTNRQIRIVTNGLLRASGWISSTYDSVTDFIVKITMRSTVWVYKFYRQSDGLFLASATYTVSGSQTVRRVLIQPTQYFDAGEPAPYVSKWQVAEGGILYPGGI